MKNKLNILHVCKSLPWRFAGGIQSHTWDLSKEMAKTGHSVSILTAGGLMIKPVIYEKQGVQIIELPYFPGRYLQPIGMLAEEYLFNLSAWFWLNKNAHKYDVVHLQGRSGSLFTGAKNAGNVITTVHGLSENEASYSQPSFGQKMYSLITQRLEKNALDKSPRLVAVSKDLKDELVEKKYAAGDKISVIPNGIQLEQTLVDKDVTIDKNQLLFVGRLHPIKGLDTLVHTMKQLPEEIKLSIVGDGPYKPELKKQIKEYGLEDRITLLGQRSREEIFDIMRGVLAVIMPSLSETQGIVILEANLQQTCVVASDLAAIRETIVHQENGLLCNPLRADEFAAAIKYLHDNPQEAKSMGKRGCQMVIDKFGWPEISQNTLNLYQNGLAA